MTFLKRNKESIVFFIIFFSFAIYLVLRACNVPITLDESMTLNSIKANSFLAILTNSIENYPAANNHLLNSLFIKTLTSMLGDSLFILRLPNLMAFIIFFASLVMLTAHWFGNRQSLRIAVILIIVSNHYLFEFFALARGYGMATGFMFLALAIASKRSRQSEGYLVILSAGLALLSSYIMIYVFVALTSLYWISRTSGFRISTPRILSSFGFILLALFQLLNIRQSNDLNYGGKNNFIADSLATVAQDYSYDRVSELAFLFALAVLFFAAIIALLTKRFKNPAARSYLVSIAGFNLQYYLFGFYFPINRTVAFLLPLSMCVIFSLLHSRIASSKLISVGTYLLALILVMRFISIANIEYAFVWADSQETPQIVADISKYPRTTLCTNWLNKQEIEGEMLVQNKQLDVRLVYFEHFDVEKIYSNSEPLTYANIDECDLALFSWKADEFLQSKGYALVSSYNIAREHLYVKPPK